MSDDNKLANVMCPTCGIAFSFLSKIDSAWRDSCKLFYCPNGHTLSYNKPTENEVVSKLKDEVKQLKLQLETVNKDLNTYKKKYEEVVLELEIWKPNSTLTPSV